MRKEKAGFLSRLRRGLNKTGEQIGSGVLRVITGRINLDETMMEELEEAFITADVGMETATMLINSLRDAVERKSITKADQVKQFLRKEIEKLLTINSPSAVTGKPHLILVVGVNGSGKTTTIGKLASHFRGEGKSVLMAAGDTFRAAAIEQLDEWSKRAGCDLVRHKPGSDPSAVAFDAIKAGVARKRDVVLVDTAGRLHTRVNLMEELKKVRRIIARELESAPHETLLVIDGTTGQNALKQVKEFNDIMPITGLVITKLDGTSKGGAIIGISAQTGIPVKYIGIGEKTDDLQPFDPRLFAEAILPPL